jgi:ribose transport system substrate-binding protein
MRKVIALLAVLLAAGGLAFFLRHRAEKSAGRPLIAVVPKGTTHEFWQTVLAGANAAAAERGVDILWQGPATESDVAGQISIVDDMINRHVNALVLAPTNSDSLVPSIQKAQAQNIPVVIFDSAASTDQYVSFVATDNEKGGALAADTLGKLLGGTGNVAILKTQPGGASTESREKGFTDEMAKVYPAITIVGAEYGNSQRDQSLAKALDLLSAHPDLNGFFASNESGSFGVMKAVQQDGLAGKVRIVGFDAADDLVDGLKAGTIDALVVQDPFGIGKRSVETACDALDGKPIDKRIDTGVLVVTRDNLDSPEAQARINPKLPTPASNP